jgi:hypothetical protein
MTSFVRWLAILGLMLPIVVTLLLGAVLKESTFFWRADSGYSIELRKFVEHMFYPVYLAIGAMLVYLTGRVSRHKQRILTHPFAFLSPLLAVWCIFAATTLIVTLDNLQRVVEGQPIHAVAGR